MICDHDYVAFAGQCKACEYVRCRACGVIRRLSGCAAHDRSDSHYDDPDYYKISFRNGILQSHVYRRELLDAWPNGWDISGDRVLEFGAGVGQYAPFWRMKGFAYAAVEISAYGRRHIREAFCAPTYATLADFELDECQRRPDVVFSAHCLEHLRAPEPVFEAMTRLTRRYFVLLVPLGTDTGNPDHWSYFSPETLTLWAVSCGLAVRAVIRKTYVPKEDYLFLFAEKEGSTP